MRLRSLSASLIRILGLNSSGVENWIRLNVLFCSITTDRRRRQIRLCLIEPDSLEVIASAQHQIVFCLNGTVCVWSSKTRKEKERDDGARLRHVSPESTNDHTIVKDTSHHNHKLSPVTFFQRPAAVIFGIESKSGYGNDVAYRETSTLGERCRHSILIEMKCPSTHTSI